MQDNQPEASRKTEEVASYLRQQLTAAVLGGNDRHLRSLLGQPAVIEYLDAPLAEGMDSALVTACRLSLPVIASTLLQHGASCTVVNLHGHSALDVAGVCHSHRCVEVILNHMTKEAAALSESPTASRDATSTQRRDNPAEVTLSMYNALCTAADAGDTQLIQIFIAHGVDINLNLDDYFGSPLHCATESGCLETVKALTAAGADIEALRRSQMQTPLMRACEFGQVDVARHLVSIGAKVDRMTDGCSTALIIACHFGQTECVKLLIDHDANPHIRNPWGFTALFMGTDTPAIVTLLLQKGVRVDEKCGDRGEAAIHLASVIGAEQTVDRLLLAGSDVNIETHYKETALWLAAWKGHVGVCELLLRNNCRMDVASNGCQVYAYDYAPVEIAMGLGHWAILRMLLVAGCSLVNQQVELAANTSHLQAPTELIPWLKLRSEALHSLFADDDIKHWFVKFITNPRSLKQQCCMSIRACLGANMTGIIRLPLPALLQEYIVSFFKFHD